MRLAKERLLAVGLSLLGLGLLLEISLRLLGSWYQAPAPPAPPPKAEAGIIVCLGDSYTYGMGAPPAYSYPMQLQRLLAEAYPHKRFSVVNMGQPAQNTTALLASFSQSLAGLKPDMVLFMGGLNNCWNYTGFAQFLHQNSWLGRTTQWLYHIKLYKLARLLTRDIYSKMAGGRGLAPPTPAPAAPGAPQAAGISARPTGLLPTSKVLKDPEFNAYLKQNHQAKIMAWLEAARRKYPLDQSICQELAQRYMKQHRYPEALSCLNRAIVLQPRDASNYREKGLLYREMQDFDTALRWFEKSLALNPADPSPYPVMASIYHLQNNEALALQMYRKYIELAPADTSRTVGPVLEIFDRLNDPQGARAFFTALGRSNAECRVVAALLRRGRGINWGVEKWIAADITKLAQLCRSQSISLVLLSYPVDIFRQYGGPLRADLFKQLASTLGLPLVDNYTVFQNLPGDSREYFVPDGHCNARGYGIIARQSFKAVQNWLKDRSRQ